MGSNRVIVLRCTACGLVAWVQRGREGGLAADCPACGARMTPRPAARRPARSPIRRTA